MISLVRENGRQVFVNPDLIETAERDDSSGLTVVALTTGNILLVSDDTAAIADKIVAFRRRYHGP